MCGRGEPYTSTWTMRRGGSVCVKTDGVKHYQQVNVLSNAVVLYVLVGAFLFFHVQPVGGQPKQGAVSSSHVARRRVGLGNPGGGVTGQKAGGAKRPQGHGEAVPCYSGFHRSRRQRGWQVIKYACNTSLFQVFLLRVCYRGYVYP